MYKVFVIFLFILCNNLFSQINYYTKNDEYIMWQKEVKLTLDDFKSDTIGKDNDNYKKTNLRAIAYTGIWSILDVPKKKRMRGKLLEKVYFAPAFQKSTSVAFVKDTLQIAMQQVCFDISEVCARGARQQLKKYQDSIIGYGTLYIMYTTVKNGMNILNKNMIDEYTSDVYINKKPNAFNLWRKAINERLEVTKEWATTPEECYRLLMRMPIDENYEQSKTVSGDLFDERLLNK